MNLIFNGGILDGHTESIPDNRWDNERWNEVEKLVAADQEGKTISAYRAVAGTSDPMEFEFDPDLTLEDVTLNPSTARVLTLPKKFFD